MTILDRFVLAAHRQDDDGWLARAVGWDPRGATAWPRRAPDPADPEVHSLNILLHPHPEPGTGWAERGATAEAALDALAERVAAALERAVRPHGRPDDRGERAEEANGKGRGGRRSRVGPPRRLLPIACGGGGPRGSACTPRGAPGTGDDAPGTPNRRGPLPPSGD